VVDASKVGPETVAELMTAIAFPSGSGLWIVANKLDLVADAEQQRVESQFGRELTVHLLSSRTGMGMDELVNALLRFASGFFTAEPALVSRERQRAHLNETVQALRGAQGAARDGREEIVAEQLRLATRALGKLLGRVDVEDILDVIFRDFCIGK
jgi:tRNA modification GTPase